MLRGELMTFLVNRAKDYRREGIFESITRNSHTNKFDGVFNESLADAVLVDFVNYLGLTQGIDLALYTEDIVPPTDFQI
jgi:hypothetical protein